MGALYHLKQKLVDFCNVIQENVSRTDTVPSSKVVYDALAEVNDAVDVTSQFVLGETISTNVFYVYKRGKRIYGYFRGSTSSDNATVSDPTLFFIPSNYIPAMGRYTISVPNVWNIGNTAVANVFNNGSGNYMVFAQKAYTKNAQYAFSFSWDIA